jgi:hypothetical protein
MGNASCTLCTSNLDEKEMSAEETIGIEDTNACDNFQYHPQSVQSKDLALTLYDLQIREACFPLHLVQIEHVKKLLDRVCTMYVKMMESDGQDIGGLDQDHIPLSLFIEVLGEHPDLRNIIKPDY